MRPSLPEALQQEGTPVCSQLQQYSKGSGTGENRKGMVPGLGNCAVVAKIWLPYLICEPDMESQATAKGVAKPSPLVNSITEGTLAVAL